MLDLAIIIPVRNEAEAIGRVLDGLPPAREIVVVDDGSTDGSGEIAASRAVRVIRHETPRGYGAALKTGLRHTSHSRVAIMDADGTYDPRDLALVAEAMPPGGLAIGARRHEPSFVRGFIKSSLCGVVRLSTGRRVPDLNSGLRVFDRRIVERLDAVLPDRFSFTTTTTLGALALGAPVRFVPVAYGPRSGHSKFKALDAVRFARTVWAGCGWIQRAEITPRSASSGLLRWAFCLVAMVLVGALLSARDLDHLAVPVMLGMLAYIPFVAAKVVRWRNLLRAFGIEVPAQDAARAYVTSLALGAVTPGRIGEFARIALATDGDGPRLPLIIATVVDRLFDLIAVAAVASVVLGAPAWLVLLGTASALVLVQPAAVWIAGRFTHRSEPTLGGGLSVSQFASAAAWTAASMGIFFAVGAALLEAAGVHGPIHLLAGGVAAGNLASLLPVSVAGLGTREPAIVGTLALAGVTVATHEAAAFAAAFHAVFTISPWILVALAVGLRTARRSGRARREARST